MLTMQMADGTPFLRLGYYWPGNDALLGVIPTLFI
jgi:hypothetical protein